MNSILAISAILTAQVLVVDASASPSSSSNGEFTGQLEGQCLNHGYSGYTYTFDLVYNHPKISPNDRVWIEYSFSGHGSINQEPFMQEIIGKDPGNEQMSATSPGEYKIQIKEFYLATGGYLDRINFFIKIKSSSGNEVRTKSPKFQYSAQFFRMGAFECFHLTNPYPLKVEAESPSNSL